MKKLLQAPAAGILAVWSFLEAFIWPIIPDFLLIILVTAKPEKYKQYFLITFLASTLGIIVFFFFTQVHPESALQMLDKAPLTNMGNIAKIEKIYATEDATVLLKQSFSGIPGKIWTYVAAVQHVPFVLYISAVSISRIIRMYLIAIMFAYIGKRYARPIKQYRTPLLIAYLLIFAGGFYLTY